MIIIIALKKFSVGTSCRKTLVVGFEHEPSNTGSTDREESRHLYLILRHHLDTLLLDKYF